MPKTTDLSTSQTQPIQAVLFDLDGTLMASSHDLTAALNVFLAEHQQPPVERRILESILSLGSAEHIKLGLSIPIDHPDMPALKERFFDLYAEQLAHHCTTPLYEGMNELLTALQQRSLPWGIVTNKYRRFAQRLIDFHQLNDQCKVLVTPEDVSKGKPSPESLLKACHILEVKPEACLYIGDHERDILAGKAANMTTITAAYGYLDDKEDPIKWEADFIAHHPKDILRWLEKNQWHLPINDKLNSLSA